MRGKKTLATLLCASIIGLGATHLPADPGIANSTNTSQLKQVKPRSYDFGEFFKDRFEWQDSVEDLISYTYTRYNKVLKKMKASYPGITLQDIMDNSGPIDKIKFLWLLVFDYSGNLNKLGYPREGLPIIEKDNLEISLVDKKRMEKGFNFPYIKFDVDVGALPERINVSEMKAFLDGNGTFMVKHENGKFFYSILRYAKN